MLPLLLTPNPVQHFYRGGDRIAALRGTVQQTDHQPEEWLGSTVTRFGSTSGLAVTAGGAILRDLVAADPAAWTGGPAHTPSDTGILVKLLDARQRLPVHVHPSRGFAASHLDCPYGKTEAWYVLDAGGDGAVYLGWREEVDPDELARRRDAQDSDWLLAHMNRVPVVAGMSIFCPAGTVHAIGEGVFVAEIQEPTDFSILLEWSVTTSTREDSHLGLGFDAVMGEVSTAPLPASVIEALSCSTGTSSAAGTVSLLAPRADRYFRLLRARAGSGASGAAEPLVSRAVPASFAVVLALAGEGRITSERGAVPISRGEAYAIPRSFGDWRLEAGAPPESGSTPPEVLVFLPGEGWPGTLGSAEL